MPLKDIRAPYRTSDALGLAKLIQRKELAPSEIMEAAIAHVEEIHPRINALVSWDYELARSHARVCDTDSNFSGVPYLEKDYSVAGLRTTNGSKFLHRLAKAAEHESEAVRRLRSAGMIPFGMTNSPEMGLEWTAEPDVYGTTLNPWNFAFSAGTQSFGQSQRGRRGWTMPTSFAPLPPHRNRRPNSHSTFRMGPPTWARLRMWIRRSGPTFPRHRSTSPLHCKSTPSSGPINWQSSIRAFFSWLAKGFVRSSDKARRST